MTSDTFKAESSHLRHGGKFGCYEAPAWAKALLVAGVAGLTVQPLPARADDTQVKMPLTITVNFFGELPRFLSFRGNIPEAEITETAAMKGDHRIEAAFDKQSPSEIKLSVTAMWSDTNYDTRRINLLPSNSARSVPVRFFEEGPNTVLFVNFNDGQLGRQVGKRCTTTDDDLDQRYFNYKRCFFIFTQYKTNARKHFKPAFRALKGAFDKYFTLMKDSSFPLARDVELEREVLEYEVAAADDGAVKSAFRSNGVHVGYFKGMIEQIGKAEVARYETLRREVASGSVSAESVPALRIETKLVKERFKLEQNRIRATKGKAPSVLNGITLEHFDGLERALDGRVTGARKTR